jgi:histone-lysine N-methyltransferase SETD1
MLSNNQGCYILFNDDTSAQRARVLDGSSFLGHRLVVNVKYPSAKKADHAPSAGAASEVKGSWRFLTITKKNRPLPNKVAKNKPLSPAAQRRRRISYSSSSSSEDEAGRPVRKRSKSRSSSRSSEMSEDEKPVEPKTGAREPAELERKTEAVATVEDEPMPLAESVPTEEAPTKASKKRAAKPKAPKGAKKARLETETVVDIQPPTAPEVAEIKLDDGISAAPTKSAKAAKPAKEPKPAKPKKVAKTELQKFLETGVVEDEEDAYWLGQALAATHEGIEPDLSDVESEDEEGRIKDGHPLFHGAGAWRAEGWKKVPVTAKAEYLPERNRAVVSSEKDANALTSGRTARVTGRRLAHDMETTRKTTTTNTAESDMFAFNQLSMRKKALRFSRSPIEGYGLYAMETIHPGEMVCEYVGEICRSAVAEVREQRYLKQGIGSSYLFRIDSDLVCDATFKGSVR